jgi:acyl dehydratase
MTLNAVALGQVPNPNTVPLDALRARIGETIGTSSWREVAQERVDRFAEVTDDHQFIHIDPERARRETPFGGSIAHGFLTLSLLSTMAYETLPTVEGRALGINYGFDRVRFLAPVRAGKRVRAHFTLADVTEREAKQVLLRYTVTVEIEGEAKPALSAEWLTLTVLA